jgi:type VI secretion system secreted protein Hcp
MTITRRVRASSEAATGLLRDFRRLRAAGLAFWAHKAERKNKAIVAYTAYISIKGKKQGQFAGDGSNKQNKNRILITSFSFSVESPHDASTGQASGKRQYQPIVIRKYWGEASPQVYQALVTNEVLTQVLVEFVTTDPQGKEVVDHSFTLTNATISQVKEFTESTPPTTEVKDLEEISFTFQKIEIKDKSGKTFTDDWEARN